MKTFFCQVCGQPVYFENTRCTQCDAVLGFLPDRMLLSALEPIDANPWRVPAPYPAPRRDLVTRLLRTAWYRPIASDSTRTYRKCANYSHYDVCNWMVPTDSGEHYCPACRVNEVIPNLDRKDYLRKWFRLERSKRRLAYSLMRFGLPVHTKAQNPDSGLAFRFMSDLDTPEDEPVLTGHANGTITINVLEADPAHREQTRVDLDERYRTILGHFRHEIGHYYWDLLIRDGGRLDSFRALFGDERKDYADALKDHYADGPREDWQQHFVSAYASSHPWEDWAESWAHYLHIVDTLETAVHFSVDIERRMADGSVQRSDPDFDPYTIDNFDPIIEHWLPLTFALNGLNRSMGLPDLYPFVLPQPAINKLAYVHGVVRECRQAAT